MSNAEFLLYITKLFGSLQLPDQMCLGPLLTYNGVPSCIANNRIETGRHEIRFRSRTSQICLPPQITAPMMENLCSNLTAEAREDFSFKMVPKQGCIIRHVCYLRKAKTSFSLFAQSKLICLCIECLFCCHLRFAETL